MKKYTKEELLKMDAIEVYEMVLKGDIIKKFPDGFWKRPEAEENAKKCMIFMFEKILKWNYDDIKNKLTKKTFQENKLSGMISTLYNNSPYEAINNLYPNKFMPWEFNNTPIKYWQDKNNCIAATKWMIEKLQWSDEDIKNKLSIEIFKENGLGGMITTVYNGSLHSLIYDVYPNKFMPWEFKVAPKEYWKNKNNCVTATKWMIEKLKWSDDDIKKKISQNIFIENGLRGMLLHSYKGCVYNAINDAYPNKFMPWELKTVPKNYWKNKNNCIAATKWMIKKLKLSDEYILENIPRRIFSENGLDGMIKCAYNGNTYRAIEDLKK